ncbi:MAG: response regulator transcription factor [Acidimicrobiales bacterium]|nr:response regulator transcription factor [Acidimicrobiales bacterium]
MAGHHAIEVRDIQDLKALRPAAGWSGSVVPVGTTNEATTEAWGYCRDSRRIEDTIIPVLVLIGGSHVSELSDRNEQFDDFILSPFHPSEMQARISHLLWRSGQAPGPEIVELGPLLLNVETYQASLQNRPLDLTFMEYELLKFLAVSPGKVFSREILLNRVWGYEYFGGARTVDVHVRRLRAKFGEEHAHLIQTVRSVGYKLDQSRAI